MIDKKNQNTTEATQGMPLRARVLQRKHELELNLGKLSDSDHTRAEVQAALDEVTGLLTGNLDQIPHVIAAELNVWLEANKHVDERHTAPPTHVKH